MIEKDFVTEGLKRTKIDEYLESELERAGYGGMEVQVTPLGTMVVVYAERPGMVIGRGGKTVRGITQNLKTKFELENPQVEVKEVGVPELNPKIMAHKIASMLQRGMHFRRVSYTSLRRIMGAGAQGVEVTISGKIRGARSATAKFSDGYIKKCGEPATRFVKEGFATVQLKPGVLGIYVRIMPPEVTLPDKVDIHPPVIEETVTEVVEETAEIVEDEEIAESAEESELIESEEELEELEESLEEVEEEAEVEEAVESDMVEEEAEVAEEVPESDMVEEEAEVAEEVPESDMVEEEAEVEEAVESDTVEEEVPEEKSESAKEKEESS